MSGETKTWGILTGEYPPVRGGVADCTAQLAAALAEAGDQVHVWAPAPLAAAPGIVAHPLPGPFHRRARRQLAAELAEQPPQLRLLLQYVPHSFGSRAMNVAWTRWLAGWQRQPLWVIFHEVAVRAEAGDGPRHHLLANVTQHMARQIRRAAARSFAATPAWESWLQELAPGTRAATWLPMPSNLPTVADAAAVAAVRRQYGAAPGGVLLASFGRFQDFAGACLRPVVRELLELHPQLSVLLIGEGGQALRGEVGGKNAAVLPRLHASGFLKPAEAAAHIAAADLLLQPYGDGISTRRGTTMAALALGRPVLTHEGAATEAVWREAQAVALAPLTALRPAAEGLLADAPRREAIAAAGLRLYQQRFALEHFVCALRAAAEEK